MKYDERKISALRIDGYTCDELGVLPRQIMDEIKPKNLTNKAWVPQTIADQVWVFFEFQSEADKINWQEKLPDYAKKMLDPELIKELDVFGWGTRDYNGFSLDAKINSKTIDVIGKNAGLNIVCSCSIKKTDEMIKTVNDWKTRDFEIDSFSITDGNRRTESGRGKIQILKETDERYDVLVMEYIFSEESA